MNIDLLRLVGVGLTCFLLTGCEPPPAHELSGTQENQQTADPPESIPDVEEKEPVVQFVRLADAKFVLPDGWTWFPADETGLSGVILPSDVGADGRTSKRIDIMAGPKKSTLEKQISWLVDSKGGTASNLEFDIDGEKAMRISFPRNPKQLDPTDGVGVIHGPTNYLFLGVSTDEDDGIWPVLQQILMSVEWTE